MKHLARALLAVGAIYSADSFAKDSPKRLLCSLDSFSSNEDIQIRPFSSGKSIERLYTVTEVSPPGSVRFDPDDKSGSLLGGMTETEMRAVRLINDANIALIEKVKVNRFSGRFEVQMGRPVTDPEEFRATLTMFGNCTVVEKPKF